MKSTPIIEYRMQYAKDFEEALFIQMTLGDDRAVQATYIAGELRYSNKKNEVASPSVQPKVLEYGVSS